MGTDTEVSRKSRVGKRPLPLPKGVTVNLVDGKVEVQGPKGRLRMRVPERVTIRKEGDKLQVESSAPGRAGARLQGLGRALLASMVKGAADGYERTLELVGTGYRAEVRGKQLLLTLGFSHPVKIELPADVAASIPADSKGAILTLTSADKAKLGQLAATIRSFRPPEPYGGKGIRYRGEFIRRKAGKAGKAAKAKGGK